VIKGDEYFANTVVMGDLLAAIVFALLRHIE
jgi:hypothetical protein